MATQSILKLITRILASPLIIASRVLIWLQMKGLYNDLQCCLDAVDAAPLLPDHFVSTLIAAEDHRSSMHPGIDPIALLRVIWVWVRTRRLQGGSTIEQQLVRVVLNRYERTVQRKIHEQLIAIALSEKRSKSRIAMTYLSIAFYGSGRYGLKALNETCGNELKTASQDSISLLVARLKYPEPMSPSIEWHRKIKKRAEYISSRLSKSAENSIEKKTAKSHHALPSSSVKY